MEIIRYDINDFAEITCMMDFYKKLNLCHRFSEDDIRDIRQIHMNRAECDMLQEYIYCNTLKRPELRIFKPSAAERKARTASAIDFVNYSPVACDDLTPGELHIYSQTELESGLR